MKRSRKKLERREKRKVDSKISMTVTLVLILDITGEVIL